MNIAIRKKWALRLVNMKCNPSINSIINKFQDKREHYLSVWIGHRCLMLFIHKYET